MALFRVEFNLNTGERLEIAQKTCRNDDGDVIVIDSVDCAPIGFYEFDQEVIIEPV